MAVEDAADAQAAQVVAVVQVRDQQLQDPLGRSRRRRDRGEQGIEERPQVVARAVGLLLGDARLGVRVEHRELELLLGGVQVDEQVVDLVQHFLGPGVAAVDLVDDQALGSVHQEHHPVHHLEGALHLAPEIAVARRVHEVDLRVLVVNRRVLGQDRDAALALQVVRVHDPLAVLLVGAEDPALGEEGVHEGGLSVVHVGDDGDVTEVHALPGAAVRPTRNPSF